MGLRIKILLVIGFGAAISIGAFELLPVEYKVLSLSASFIVGIFLTETIRRA